MNPKVDAYLSQLKNWQEELKRLRTIILDCGLHEDFKWRNPCYTFQEKNIVIIGSFKNHCTISFFKGCLLKDTHNILEKPGENSRVARIIKFTSVKDINKIEPFIKNYIFEAIEVEKAGLEVKLNEEDGLDIPEELQLKFNENPDFKTAFENLTPGRQRGYLLHFSSAKQSKTRISRIEKTSPRILDGKGLMDCVCGLSKKMPNCDGSHKFIKRK